MSRITADKLREVLIALMIENAQVRAAAGPVVLQPRLEFDELPLRFDEALHEFNEYRANGGLGPVEVDATFKQAVIDSLQRRFEKVGRVVIEGLN